LRRWFTRYLRKAWKPHFSRPISPKILCRHLRKSLTADGNPVVANETLIAPAHTSARASREIVVKAGNAAGVSFLLNGKTIPAQGNEGETRTYVFDATGLRTAPGAGSLLVP
jgi:hypothetical protein